ncbi:MAG TPA: hypothetical protein VL426_06365 [Candidatus Binatia bacterium]|jgi:hypothetical protein|nr:hypothetical protein [Candidatus Binatia bacterium]
MWKAASMVAALGSVLALLEAAARNSNLWCAATLALLVASGYCDWRADKAART